MLSGIFGKKSDHPLADIQGVQTLLDDLPKNDVIRLVMDVTELIESLMDDADFKLDHHCAVLRMLDEYVQPYARKLAREYFSPRELNPFQENRLLQVLGNLAKHTAHAYTTVFGRYCSTEKVSNAVRDQVPLLTVRTVNAMIAQLKYVCARYDHVDKMFWGNLAQLYKHAEQQRYLDTPVNLYQGVAGNTSVRCEVARLLGWYGVEVNALSPLYMHLTERILAHHCLGVGMSARQDDHNLFSFDLALPAAPLRVKLGAQIQPTMQFINMSAMRTKLEMLLKILDKNIVPDDLNLGGNYEAVLVKEAVQHLLTYLIAPPSRRSERRRVTANYDAVSGFAGLLACVDAGLNDNRKKTMTLALEDISAGGFHAVLPPQRVGDARIGGLLGLRSDGAAHWGVAIVRRMRRDDKNQMHVGAEMLSHQVVSVALKPSLLGGGAAESSKPALCLLENQGQLPKEIMLLMDIDSFSFNHSLHTVINEKKYLLIPIDLLEKCDDCDLARFRIVEQEIDPEETY